MVDISTKIWNKAEVATINIYENDDVNKTVLLLHCISDASKRGGSKDLYDLIDKEIKGKYRVDKMGELAKPQIRKSKIDIPILFKGSKNIFNPHKNAIQIIRLKNIIRIKFRVDLGFNQINLILKENNQ